MAHSKIETKTNRVVLFHNVRVEKNFLKSDYMHDWDIYNHNYGKSIDVCIISLQFSRSSHYPTIFVLSYLLR